VILADTSVWIGHFRSVDDKMLSLIKLRMILCHPYVIGEIILGSLSNRDEILSNLQDFPKAPVAQNEDVLQLIATHRLFGRGIGYVDVHLVASALLQPGTQLWSRDKKLKAAAEELGVAAPFN
jgi:predicted nucleic acid-binding protein